MPKKKPYIIDITKLTIRFGDYTALEDVTLGIKRGSITAVVGPNGSGKSTLVRAIIGLERITSGTITIDGAPITEAIGRIGYVPQRFSFDKTLPITVQEFLELTTVCRKKEHCKSDSIEHVLDLVDMTLHRQKQLGSLSGGQLQRILIARALLHERDIMILDEPSSGIDAAGERDLYALIKDINASQKTTFLIVSHELDFISKCADRVICLNRRLICHDTPEKALLCEGVANLYGPHIAIHHHHKDGHHPSHHSHAEG